MRCLILLLWMSHASYAQDAPVDLSGAYPELDAQDREAQALYELAEYDEAIRLQADLVQKWEALFGPDSLEVSAALMNLVAYKWKAEQVDEALPLAKRVLRIREAHLAPDDPVMATTLNNVAQMYKTSGQLATARALWDRALEIQERVLDPDDPALALTLNNLASLYATEGQYDAALQMHQRALDIRERAFGLESREVGVSANNIGQLFHETGRHAAGLPYLVRSLRILEWVHGADHPTVAVVCSNLASVLQRLGRYSEARALHERALRIFETRLGPEHPKVAGALNNFAALLSAQGDHATARDILLRAYEIYLKAYGDVHPRTAAALANVAVERDQAGDREGARDLHLRALAIYEEVFGPDHPKVADSLHHVARFYIVEGKLPEARAALERAMRIHTATEGADSRDVVDGHGMLGRVLKKLGEIDAARAHMAFAVEATRNGEVIGLHRRALSRLASLEDLAGNPQRARELAEEALALETAFVSRVLPTLSEREALHFSAHTRDTVDLFLSLFDAPEEARQVYQRSLTWKGAVARALAIRRAATLGSDGEATAIGARLGTARRQLATVSLSGDAPPEEVDRWTAEVDALERELAATAVGAQGTGEVTLWDLCDALPEASELVDFMRYERQEVPHYTAFILNSDDCEVRRVALGPAEPIDTAVHGHREALQGLSDQLTERIDRRGARVRELVWTPLQVTADRVVIVPDGGLAGLSFAALPTGADRYLLEDVTLSYLESATDLLRPRHPSGEGTLLVGALDYGAPTRELQGSCLDEVFQPLPGTDTEIAEIGRLSARRKQAVHTLTGRDADEDAVLAGMASARVVHLATHGFFAAERCQDRAGIDAMALSGVALSAANEARPSLTAADGLLTAAELSTVDLRGTELVVLSACETGLGEVHSGEGVLGLRRAFAATGARTWVMSLWSVSDAATTSLMVDFYRQLSHRKPPGPSEALRRAQIAMLARNRREHHDARPSEWAAFVAAGD